MIICLDSARSLSVKDGFCPIIKEPRTNCPDAKCSADDGCTGMKKCCEVPGCGKTCQEPSFTSTYKHFFYQKIILFGNASSSFVTEKIVSVSQSSGNVLCWKPVSIKYVKESCKSCDDVFMYSCNIAILCYQSVARRPSVATVQVKTTLLNCRHALA